MKLALTCCFFFFLFLFSFHTTGLTSFSIGDFCFLKTAYTPFISLHVELAWLFCFFYILLLLSLLYAMMRNFSSCFEGSNNSWHSTTTDTRIQEEHARSCQTQAASPSFFRFSTIDTFVEVYTVYKHTVFRLISMYERPWLSLPSSA